MSLTSLIRYVNVPKKTKDLMLITYLKPTYLWCFSPDPKVKPILLPAYSTAMPVLPEPSELTSIVIVGYQTLAP